MCRASPGVRNINHSQQEHTAGKLRDFLKPGVIQEASHLRKSSGIFSWAMALICCGGRRTGWAVLHLNMVLLCSMFSTFGIKWVQPWPLQCLISAHSWSNGGTIVILPGSSPASSQTKGRSITPKGHWLPWMVPSWRVNMWIVMNSLNLLKHPCLSSVCLSSSQDG